MQFKNRANIINYFSSHNCNPMEPKKVAETTLTVIFPGSFDVLAIFFFSSWTISFASNWNTATDVAYKDIQHDLCITPLARPKHSCLGEVLGDRRAVISCDLGNSLHQLQKFQRKIYHFRSVNYHVACIYIKSCDLKPHHQHAKISYMLWSSAGYSYCLEC